MDGSASDPSDKEIVRRLREFSSAIRELARRQEGGVVGPRDAERIKALLDVAKVFHAIPD